MKTKKTEAPKQDGLSEAFSTILKLIKPTDAVEIELKFEDVERAVNALPRHHRRPANGKIVEISGQAYEVINGWERSGKSNDVLEIIEGLKAHKSDWSNQRIAEAEAFLKMAVTFECEWLAEILQEKIEDFENRKIVVIPGINDSRKK